MYVCDIFFWEKRPSPLCKKKTQGRGWAGLSTCKQEVLLLWLCSRPPTTKQPLTVSPGVLSSISDPQLSGLHQLAPARVTVTYTSSKLRLALPSEILKVPPHRHPTQLSCVCPAWRISQKQRCAYPGSRSKSQKGNKTRQDTSPAQICAAVSDSTGHFPQQSPSKPPV